MPYEGTGHIDMWAKVTGYDLVVVSQLDGFAMQEPLAAPGETGSCARSWGKLAVGVFYASDCQPPV